LEQVGAANGIDKVVVSSENEKVLQYCYRFSDVLTLKRNETQNVTLQRSEELAKEVLDYLRDSRGYEPDAVCILFVNTPLRKAHHIDWAINTMRIFNVETVVSIQEELAHCYHHRKFGLIPISSSRSMRLERDAIYKENGAIFLSKSDVIKNNKLIGESVGHISMLQEESIKINSDYEYWLAEKLLRGEFSNDFDQ
jgi:CMP-N-acetylneuraminic acid synthetase